jgi:hypothetical protein
MELRLAMSGLSQRAKTVLKLASEAQIDQDLISYATVIRCLTRSKSVITFNDYEYCGNEALRIIKDNDFRIIMCFGSVPARLLLGRTAESIDKFRGKSYAIDEGRSVVVTYALSILTDQGCSGCGRSVYPHLVLKDLAILRNEMVKTGVIS